MDLDVLAERILLDLKNTFKKDPLIDEFDVLPVHESVSNKCPVIHIDHKIALEDWCVKHVYVYAYSKFFAWKKKPYKIDPDSLLNWANAILLINSEIESVWNTRKEFICQGILLPENELKFAELVLSRKPKSAPVYSHRKWILSEMKRGYPSPCLLQQIIDRELLLCSRSANLYPNNYYAWSHRSWVVKELGRSCTRVISEELKATEQWSSCHVSDHCGFHYRQFLLSSSQTQENCCARTHPDIVFPDLRKLLLCELQFLSVLQRTFPGHETLWYHRRYILHELDRWRSSGDPAPERRTSADEDSCKLLVRDCSLTCGEETFLAESFRSSVGNEWERILIQRHVKWLGAVLSWHVTLALS